MNSGGVLFNWNVFPSTRVEIAQLPAPIGCLYQPLAVDVPPHTHLLSFSSCGKCGAYVNPFDKLDGMKKIWKCQFCHQKSFLPNNGADGLPEQAFIEQVLPDDISRGKDSSTPDVVVLVIDLYQHREETKNPESLRFSILVLLETISKAIANLADNTLVGIITFDKDVRIHKISGGDPITFGFEELYLQEKYNITELFAEESSIVRNIINKLCGASAGSTSSTSSTRLPQAEESILIKNGILAPLNPILRAGIESYLVSLKPKFTQSYRPIRSFGLCLYISTVIIHKLSFQNFNGKLLAFLSGPNTTQPGIVLNPDTNTATSTNSKSPAVPSSFRLHNDIKQLNSYNFNSSQTFFEVLSYVANGLLLSNALQIGYDQSKKSTDFELNPLSPKWSIDVFTGSLDQVGLYEMKKLILNVNGDIYMTNSFLDSGFKGQLESAIRNIATYSHNATLTILTSPRLKVKSLVGHGYHLPSSYKDGEQYKDKLSDQITKFESKYKRNHFTNRWFWNTVHKDDAVSIFFEIDGLKSYSDRKSLGDFFIQFQYRYWDKVQKCWKMRVLTRQQPVTTYFPKKELSLSLVDSNIELLQSFNAKCWVTLFCRLLINKLDTNIGFEFEGIQELIDSVTVKLLSNFNKLIVEKYPLNDRLKDLPLLVYNLRRNPQLISVFNSSPDETTFYHHWFMKLEVNLSATVIKPELYSYCKPSGCELASISKVPMDSDVIDTVPDKSYLIMDSVFFNIIYYKYADQQDKLPLHHSNNEDYQFKIEPWEFIKDIKKGRRLEPKYIITQTNHSQSRYLLSRLNPMQGTSPTPISIAVAPKKISWFQQIFGGGKEDFRAGMNTNLLSDEASFQAYCDAIVERVKGYKIENDY